TSSLTCGGRSREGTERAEIKRIQRNAGEGREGEITSIHLLVEVLEGSLQCPDSGRRFPISRGVPNLLLSEDDGLETPQNPPKISPK
uniref:Uncharacterized protein n=1 Tax=Serinus canaria TaxID=9135 RepID=A0A8C9N363_SERCA